MSVVIFLHFAIYLACVAALESPPELSKCAKFDVIFLWWWWEVFDLLFFSRFLFITCAHVKTHNLFLLVDRLEHGCWQTWTWLLTHLNMVVDTLEHGCWHTWIWLLTHLNMVVDTLEHGCWHTWLNMVVDTLEHGCWQTWTWLWEIVNHSRCCAFVEFVYIFCWCAMFSEVSELWKQCFVLYSITKKPFVFSQGVGKMSVFMSNRKNCRRVHEIRLIALRRSSVG